MSDLMSKQVLVLNGDYQPLSKFPLSVIGMKKVIKSLLKNRVNVVKEYDETIKLNNEIIHLPKIVVLNRYIQINHTPRFSRQNVYLRDNYTCQYCGRKFKYDDLTYDHIIPQCKGGKTTWDNITTCCKECNHKKGSKSMEEAHMKLLSKPFIPSISHLEKNNSSNKQDFWNYDWDKKNP